ncbi:hypothetical protein SLE2022_091530 [Rubroshorea leprosula]
MATSCLLPCIAVLFLAAFVSSSRNMSLGPIQVDVPNDFSYVCDPQRFRQQGLDMDKFTYCNKSLSYQVRAKDLVDQMTLDDKVQQMGNSAKGVFRIGLPKYEWWSEALHGVSDVGPGVKFDNVVPGATSFPTVILTAASFNQSLWRNIGQVVSTEARAMYNLGNAGLTFWSPNINVVRDPRWGRITETAGEDPFVVGTYAINYVRGLQDVQGAEQSSDPNSRPLKVSSCCKHYTAYDVDAWEGVDRFHFNALVAEQDMLETFNRPFEMCVKDGDVSSVMCSYNRVNGFPTCADPNLLKGTIREEWDLHGYIVSDCDSIEVMVDGHKWLDDKGDDASAQTLKAGLDLDCGDFYPDYLKSAVLNGKVREAEIDRSLNYLYVVLMRLGFFDGIEQYKSLGKGDVCTEQHIALASQAAREGTVLLKNEGGALPLSHVSKLAVIGPLAKATELMLGNYAGIPCQFVSPLDGLTKVGQLLSAVDHVIYQPGCGDPKCQNDSLILPAINAAKDADATIIFVGTNLSIENEGLDRTDLYLPGYQTQLINQVAAVSKGPVILVIMSAGGVDIQFAKDNEKIKSILWAGWPGEEGGLAIADVIFGRYNPGGKLPITWYTNEYVKQLPMTSMPLRPVDGYPGRTYKFYEGPTVYPFGYGISYTNFKYEVTSSPASLRFTLKPYQHCHSQNYMNKDQDSPCPAIIIEHSACTHFIQVEVTVHNVGMRDGNEVVMVYSAPPPGIVGAPIKQLIGFQRVHVAAGQNVKVKFSFNACDSFNIIDAAAYNLLPSGTHKILVADESVPLEVNFDY